MSADLPTLRANYERETSELVPWGRPFYKAATALIEALESELQEALSSGVPEWRYREMCDRVAVVTQERDAARAENERLQVENAYRLKNAESWLIKDGEHVQMFNEVRAENERLEALLAEIAPLFPSHGYFTDGTGTKYCHDCYEASGCRHRGNEWPCRFARAHERLVNRTRKPTP